MGFNRTFMELKCKVRVGAYGSYMRVLIVPLWN